ncbi:MAG: DUF4203 domain-containing protein [Candidatus Hydrogenedentales bacterium]|jgi:hypothetical protein
MDLIPDLSKYPVTTVNGAIALGIAVGTLYCFLGYRVLKFVLCLTGFGLAGAVAGAITAWASQAHMGFVAGAMLGGGICGAVAMLFLFRTGVFLVGALAALLIAQNLLAAREESWSVWLILGSALAGGMLALVLERLMMTMATAAIGAWLVVCGIGFFLVGPTFVDVFQEPIELGRDRGIVALCWAVLATAGALAQLATTRKRRPRPAE